MKIMKKKCVSGEEGFTLLEVVIALAVVTIGIFSLMALQVGTIKGNAFANTMTRATYSGSDVIELLQAKSYNDPVLSTAAGNNPHTDVELASAILAPGVTGVNWVVIGGAVTNTKDIVVTVSYRDRSAAKNLVLNFTKAQVIR